MDLALELGMTERQLSRVMSEHELALWMRYAAQKVLPARRIEFYLANIARVVANSAGNKMTLQDFLFDFGKKAPKATAKGSAIAFASMAGGLGFRKLGQGRKKKAT